MISLPLADLYINGCAETKKSGERFPDYNPATGVEIRTIGIANNSDIDRAVDLAKKAQKNWAEYPPQARAKILRKTAEILRQYNDKLALWEVYDTGKPIREASTVDIISGAEVLEFFADLISATPGGEHWDLGQASFYTRRDPLGVCAGIGAWNYPIQIACWKAAPALSCGNSMVFKPAELTPLSSFLLAEIFTKAGLPAGVFNVIQGPAAVGEALVQHPGIAKVSLTGEVDTGKKVMAAGANTLKQISLELGGKSPLLLLEDFPLDLGVSVAMAANYYTQGEVCSNGTRVFVHKKREQEFLQAMKARVAELKVGDPQDMNTEVGALISPEHRQLVWDYINQGESEGAELLVGGQGLPEHLEGGTCAAGNFVKPTLFAGCHDDMKIVKEEIFGPVMAVLSYESQEELLERSNSTSYGLAAGIVSSDVGRAMNLAKDLECGVCWINDYNITPPQMPFGGVKLSGIGRENGHAALACYSQAKSVYVSHELKPLNF